MTGPFTFALWWSRCWQNLIVIAGWQFSKRFIQCLPNWRQCCRGCRDIAYSFNISTCSGCSWSSRASQNLTIEFSSSGVSSCCVSCAAVRGWAPLGPSHRVLNILPYVEAATWMDVTSLVKYAHLACRMSFSLSAAGSLCFTLPMAAVVQWGGEN
jgi:hypothetical protein